MSGDRELLELAAKAAGLELTWESSYPYPERIEYFRGLPNYFPWLPLDSSNDALNLAIAIKAKITIGNSIVMVETVGFPDVVQPFTESPRGATCRAIVRAAAEIGASLPNLPTSTQEGV